MNRPTDTVHHRQHLRPLPVRADVVDHVNRGRQATTLHATILKGPTREHGDARCHTHPVGMSAVAIGDIPHPTAIMRA